MLLSDWGAAQGQSSHLVQGALSLIPAMGRNVFFLLCSAGDQIQQYSTPQLHSLSFLFNLRYRLPKLPGLLLNLSSSFLSLSSCWSCRTAPGCVAFYSPFLAACKLLSSVNSPAYTTSLFRYIRKYNPNLLDVRCAEFVAPKIKESIPKDRGGEEYERFIGR